MVKEHGTIRNHAFVIFGATGDLTRRKLLPALYRLHTEGVLPQRMPIVCVARREQSKRDYLNELALPFAKESGFASFVKRISYVQLDFQSGDSAAFAEELHRIEQRHKCGANRVLYLAVGPDLFKPVSELIAREGLNRGRGWQRVVFEKPFGHDVKSARELNAHIRRAYREEQIFRIDHYLAKDIVQNLLVFRFANSLFEHLWNKGFVDHVQLTFAESIGVGLRAGYYDKAGAVRDVLQNHALQVLALTAMEPPKSLHPEHIRDAKVAVLRHLRVAGESVLGQYGKGKIDAKAVPSYRKEVKQEKSSTETFVALKAFVDTPRWKGVPFYIRAGKRLSDDFADVTVVLKDVLCNFFCEERVLHGPNVISFRIQPDSGIAFRLNAKAPDSHRKMVPVQMEFCYPCEFGRNTPQAYEILLKEIMVGDHTLFTRWDGVEASWKFVDQLRASTRRFPNYEAGSMGPAAAERLLKKDGREWIMLKRRFTG